MSGTQRKQCRSGVRQLHRAWGNDRSIPGEEQQLESQSEVLCWANQSHKYTDRANNTRSPQSVDIWSLTCLNGQCHVQMSTDCGLRVLFALSVYLCDYIIFTSSICQFHLPFAIPFANFHHQRVKFDTCWWVLCLDSRTCGGWGGGGGGGGEVC